LRTLSILTVVTLVAAYALAFFYAPMDAVEGIRQKIFYLHVPLALVSLGGFVTGGVFAVQHLRTGDRKHDLRSYVSIHMALIFGIGALLTGSIWARAAWGHWWLWDEPLLVSFLIIFLLYACYQPLRFAIEDPERQARYASVFAVIAGVFVPVNFAAVRFAQENTHPRTLSSSHNLPGEAWLAFFVALAGMVLLYITLCRYEMAAKRVRGHLRKLRRRLGEDIVAGRSAAPQ